MKPDLQQALGVQSWEIDMILAPKAYNLVEISHFPDSTVVTPYHEIKATQKTNNPCFRQKWRKQLQKAILNVVQFWRTLEWFLDVMYLSLRR